LAIAVVLIVRGIGTVSVDDALSGRPEANPTELPKASRHLERS
jgi:hypothetical protein